MTARARTHHPTWIAFLSAASIALVAAFVILPAALLGNPESTLSSLVPSLAEYWNAGDTNPSQTLTDLVTYWRDWHVIKVTISLALVAVAIAVSASLWGRYVEGEGGASRVGSAIGGVLATVLSVAAAGLAAINAQAASVPLVALFPLVNVPSDDPAVAQPLSEMTDALTTGTVPSGHEEVARVVVTQVGLYTVFLAAAMAILAAVAGAAGIITLVRFTRAQSDHRVRVASLAVGGILLLSSLIFLAVSVVSFLSAMDAGPTAAGLLGG